ncbi:cellulase family glycosylhydrolase [Saccharibacillus sp. JS10]|uniref:cellulase family glycosylhydrolase n=1 Tax=Saccharibacillus sp. JS10 TaxID=2950552 RepID=UPI00210B5BB8|nr:cellulase family glycosylhydrolase [Saccharibacillus sp. JS10]MCQ4085270.1 cellulase family glycosylhydrolase [Saccharibacillus sp. JS10]
MDNCSWKTSKSIVLMCLITILLAACIGTSGSASAKEASSSKTQSFVDKHGQLSIVKGQLTDQHGKPVQLKGMSSHGIQWYGDYVNKNSMKWLRDDWGMNVFRIAMYTESGGYLSNPSLKNKMKQAVDDAVDLGVYVIIDWHILSDGDPNTHKKEAKAFFKEMAQLYKNTPNVIYEIANEPNGNVNWSQQIKPYAQDVIATIRKEDPKNLIIVGTGTWSQDIHDAAASPLTDKNVLYAVHFYAGTHGAWLRDRIDAAMAKGLAVFVSEWGTSDASGNGGPYLTEALQWTTFMNTRKISWTNWSLADKQEASAALAPGASVNGGWTQAQLSASGKFVRQQMLAGSTSSAAPSTKPPVQSPKPSKPNPAPAKPSAPSTTVGDLTLLYRNLDNNHSDNARRPVFNIRNNGSQSIDLKNLKIRYYFNQKDGAALQYFCDWAQIGASHVKASFGKTKSDPTIQYVELSFTSDAGAIPAKGESGEIQSRIHRADWSEFDERQDYSYKLGQSKFAESQKVVLYQNGKKVLGLEP